MHNYSSHHWGQQPQEFPPSSVPPIRHAPFPVPNYPSSTLNQPPSSALNQPPSSTLHQPSTATSNAPLVNTASSVNPQPHTFHAVEASTLEANSSSSGDEYYSDAKKFTNKSDTNPDTNPADSTTPNNKKQPRSAKLKRDPSKPPRKRQRLTLVCDNCKKRKIKCDKGHPCNSCLRSNLRNSCHYSNWFVASQPAADASGNNSLGDLDQHNSPVPYDHLHNNHPNNSSATTSFSSEVAASPPTIPSSDHTKLEIQLLKDKIKFLEDLSSQQPHPELSSTSPPTHPSSQLPHPQHQNDQITHPPQAPSQPATTNPTLIANSTVNPQPAASASLTPPMSRSTTLPPSTWPTADPLLKTSAAAAILPSNVSPPPPNVSPPPPNVSPPPPSHKESKPTQTKTQATDNGTPSITSPPPNAPSCASRLPNYQEGCLSRCTIDSLTTAKYSCSALVGVNPVANMSETINFYENYSTIHSANPLKRINYGPISWSSIMKRDDGLNMLWEYMLKMDPTASRASADSTSQPNKYQIDSMQTLDEHNRQIRQKYNDMIEAWNNKSKQVLSVSDKNQLKHRILGALASKRLVWALVERYFIYVYPFLPFIDETHFVSQLERIIGPRPAPDIDISQRITQLNIEKKSDFATIGVLLVVQRIAFISLFSNNQKSNLGIVRATFTNRPSVTPSDHCLKNIACLVDHPVTVESIDVACTCLQLFPLSGPSSLKILQLMIFLRVYNFIAPEDNDGGNGDAQMSNAIIVQLAYQNGLNREPSLYGDTANLDPKLCHLRRKLWYYVVFGDLYYSFTFGNPTNIDSMYYDAKFPFSTDDNANVANVSVEKEVMAHYYEPVRQFMEPLKKVLKLVLSIEGKTKMIEVSEMLSHYETIFFSQYLSLENCLEPDDDWGVASPEGSDEDAADQMVQSKAFSATNPKVGKEMCQQIVTEDSVKLGKIKFYFSMVSFFVSIYFHLYLFYINKNHNLSFFYLKKSFIFLLEIIPYYARVVDGSYYVCDFILNPIFEMTAHKANQIIVSFILKLRFVAFEMKKESASSSKPKNPNYYQYLNTVENCCNSLIRLSRYSIFQIAKLSDRYLFAWKMTKAHQSILETIIKDKFYEDNYDHQKSSALKMPKYSRDQLKELNSLVKDTISKTVNVTNNQFDCFYTPDEKVDDKWTRDGNSSIFDIFNDEI